MPCGYFRHHLPDDVIKLASFKAINLPTFFGFIKTNSICKYHYNK